MFAQEESQPPLCIRRRTAHLAVGFAVFFSTALTFLRADELPGPLTLDIPVPVNLATPAWLGHPSMPNDTLQTLALPIAPPTPDAALLITVYFTERDNGFLRSAEVFGENTHCSQSPICAVI